MIDRDQPPSSEDEIRRAVFGQVDLQTAELEIVSSIYDGFAAAIVVKGQPRTIALTREYGDAVQLMAMIEQGRSPQSAASEAGAAAGDPKGRRSIYDAAYDSIRKGAPGLSDATCAAIARSINLKVANGSASERGAVEPSCSESFIADEDDGPVSGIVIDLPDGSQIWTGECSSALLDSMGDERPDGSCLFLTVAIKGKPTRVVASIASTQDGIALARALAAAHVTRSAEPGAIDEDWIRGLIGEAVVMAEDQEREDESDEEICRIAESVLNAIRPYLRAQPPAREDAQPVGVKALVDSALTYTSSRGHAPGFGPLGKLHEAALAVKRSPLYTRPAPDAPRVAVEALEFYRDAWNSEPNGDPRIEGDASGSLTEPADALLDDKGTRASVALAALQAEQKGGV